MLLLVNLVSSSEWRFGEEASEEPLVVAATMVAFCRTSAALTETGTALKGWLRIC